MTSGVSILARLALVLAFVATAARPAAACTAFQLRAGDGAWVYFRSMEFGYPIESQLLIVPRGTEYTGTLADGQPGIRWTVKYGFVGPNQSFVPNQTSDGMNERGLVVGMLLFPGFAKYPPLDPAQTERTLANWELSAYLLSTCASVEEVRETLTSGRVHVADCVLPAFGGVLPLHFYVTDKTGAVLVVEYVDGQLKLHDNPLGALTNSPSFDWHVTNLMNYVNVSDRNARPMELGAQQITNVGQGSGALGLPGDFTPPSRFVRAALFASWARPGATALDTVREGFHVLNAFDLFDGVIRSDSAESKATLNGRPVSIDDKTQWVIAHDRQNLITYLRTYESLEVQQIDLKKVDFTQGGLRQIELNKQFRPAELHDTAGPQTAGR